MRLILFITLFLITPSCFSNNSSEELNFNDKNGNKIPDHIDEYLLNLKIIETVEHNNLLIKAHIQYTLAISQILNESKIDENSAYEISKKVSKANKCISYIYLKIIKKPSLIMRTIEINKVNSMLFNSQDKLRKYSLYNSLLHGRQYNSKVNEFDCDFNFDKESL